MKIISCNVNGIRSAYKKGMVDFINTERPDILCLQEIKAKVEDLPDELLNIDGYHLFLNSANKKGYSGVAIYTKQRPIAVNKELGLDRFDMEGRLLELEYIDLRTCSQPHLPAQNHTIPAKISSPLVDVTTVTPPPVEPILTRNGAILSGERGCEQDLTILNLYFPHGGRQKENLEYKLQVYQKLFEKLRNLRNKNVILIGDFNIAHQEIDLARPKQNINNIMFTVQERQQINTLIDLGFVDSFRKLNNNPDYYTWWPYAFNARDRNMGWRIDYIFVSSGLSKDIVDANIYSTANFSDHCPIGINSTYAKSLPSLTH